MGDPNHDVGGTELRTLSSRPNESGHHAGTFEIHEDISDVQEFEPIDRGRAAWRMLFSAFVFESLLWGKSSPVSTREVLCPLFNQAS